MKLSLLVVLVFCVLGVQLVQAKPPPPIPQDSGLLPRPSKAPQDFTGGQEGTRPIDQTKPSRPSQSEPFGQQEGSRPTDQTKPARTQGSDRPVSGSGEGRPTPPTGGSDRPSRTSRRA